MATKMKVSRALFLAMALGFVLPPVRAGAPINEWCPVTPEEPADPFFTTTYEGKTIGLCCRSCVRSFNADPRAYLANLPGFLEADTPSPSEDTDIKPTRSDRQEKDISRRFQGWIGSFHVLSIHFPIALIMVSGLLELAGALRGRGAWTQSARTVYVLGSLSAYPAAILGWISAGQSHYPDTLRQTLEIHRWFGTAVPVLATIGLLALFQFHRKKSKKSLLLFRITLFLMVIVIPVTAHVGGTLVHGLNYFSF
ncbi:MAG: hypothetical protein JJU29_10295 [Verrucomicrobia bacterium]|nr:hypothetical protein [Verrucomicrobiota bacterium]